MHGWAQWQALDEQIGWLDRQITEHASHDPQTQRCMAICGVGRITASAVVATVVNARQFRNGRQMAAWIGLVPKQNSSGGKQRLGRITKQGSDYLRTLLFQARDRPFSQRTDAMTGSRAGSSSCMRVLATIRRWSRLPTSTPASSGPYWPRTNASIHPMRPPAMQWRRRTHELQNRKCNTTMN